MKQQFYDALDRLACDSESLWDVHLEPSASDEDEALLRSLIDNMPTEDCTVLYGTSFIDLCRGDIGALEITGHTLYELTGDMRDFDEMLDEYVEEFR